MSFSRFTFRLKYIRIFFVMSYIYIMFKFKSCIYIPNNTFFDIVKTIFFKFKFFFYIKHLVSCQRYLCPMIKDAGSPTNYPYYLPFQLYIVLGHKLSIIKKTNEFENLNASLNIKMMLAFSRGTRRLICFSSYTFFHP